MKKSVELEIELKEVEHKNRELWRTHGNKFWENGGRELGMRINELKEEISTEKNRELDVGDGATINYYSDSHACTVIKKTKKTITLQRDKATLDPNFHLEWEVGGFAGHCSNNEEQTYTYERDENGEIYKCYWSEKEGRYRYGTDGSIKVSIGRHEFYDYNF